MILTHPDSIDLTRVTTIFTCKDIIMEDCSEKAELKFALPLAIYNTTYALMVIFMADMLGSLCLLSAPFTAVGGEVGLEWGEGRNA